MEPVESNNDFSDNRLELLDLLLQEEGLAVPSPIPAITRRTADTPAYASFAQNRQWFLYQLNPDSPFYNVYSVVRLKGVLQPEILEQSLNELVRRHETLRTSFEVVDDQVLQVIAPYQPLPLPVIDLSHLPEAERESKVIELARADSIGPFDLTKGPLFRVFLMKLESRHHILMLNMHHIISDEWSFDIIWHELDHLYKAFVHGQPSALPALPVQYADYAVWQRNRLQGEVLEKELAYWKKQLGGNLPVLELPTDYPRPAIQTYHGASETLVISPELSEAIKKIGQAAGDTPFMTLFAVFASLLYRYSGQEDILVGTPIANRGQPEVEGLIGFFVNTLVLRVNLANNPTFKELLGRVREIALEAYDHQELPFEKLVEQLQPERDPSRNPLFQVMFNYQPNGQPENFANLTVSYLDVDNSTSHFDLSILLQETQNGLAVHVNYNTDLFAPLTMQRLLTHFKTLLGGIVAAPEQSISKLPILPDTEVRLLADWNNTQVAFPQTLTLHQLFEIQAAQTPDAIAVIFENQSLTYKMLDQRANQLGHYLRRLNVGPDVLVGICIERSLEMVVALLGVLKAGGAYIPIDPEYPAERVEFMLEDAQVPVLLTQKALLTTLPKFSKTLIVLDDAWETIGQEMVGQPEVELSTENLAYVIYTSGSTGKPKGTMMPHRAICNHMHWITTTFSFGKADRVIQKTPFSFDASIWEFYAPLMTGGQLILAKPGGHKESDYLAGLIKQHQITILQVVPSLLRVLLAEKEFKNTHSLKYVFCGGEMLTAELQEEFFSRSKAKLVNLYGPTETAIDATYWICQQGGNQHRVPIGRPVANTQTYILDANLKWLPIGVQGELHIGGIQLAKGYLNRPQLTTEKFIAHPFSNNPTDRLYKSGDLARYRADGSIEFLGRIDHQVKLRGFRIELGEIEAVLKQHPDIRENVVVVREDIPGDNRLVAYLVQTTSTPVNELRQFLKEKLPEYMVPAIFVNLETLPLTPNGKIDRKALPVPEQNLTIQTDLIEPRTETEINLVAIWADVLGLQTVGVNQNFFEIGGHSLLAIKIVARIRAKFEIDFLLRHVFEKPTIAELAQLIETEAKSHPQEQKPVLKRVSRELYLRKQSL